MNPDDPQQKKHAKQIQENLSKAVADVRHRRLSVNAASKFCMADVGFPLTSKIFRLNVVQFCHENGINNRFAEGYAGRYWLNAFLKRNPEVKKRKAQRLNYG